MSAQGSALIIFFKWAKAGKVKTRLVPLLSEGDAARLYAAFVKDIVAKATSLKGIKVLGYVSGTLGEGGELETHLSAQALTWREQRGVDLGERMMNAFQDAFREGFQRVVIIGTDSPDLPISYVADAFETLSHPRNALCIGAAEDGGYYLLGMNRFFPEAFQNVPYSSPDTYRATLRQIAALPTRVFTLRRWYDVDAPSDLLRLSQSLQTTALPFTAAALAEIERRSEQAQ